MRLSDDTELNHLDGHPVGCLCSDCNMRHFHLDRLEDQADERIHAEEVEAREAAVPLEVRQRQIAEGEYAEAAVQAHRIGEVRRKVQFTRDARLYRASTLVRESRGGKMADGAFSEFTKAVHGAGDLAERGRELAALEDEFRQRAIDARVVSEPAPYEDGSPHSWIMDCFAAVGGDPISHRVATGHDERLRRHAEDVGRALQERSAYGQAIERSYLAKYRQDDRMLSHEALTRGRQELRGLATGGGATASASGGGAASFLPPAILMNAWATFRSPHTSFVDQLNHDVALPSYGGMVYIPTWTSGTTVATHTELAAVAEGDPVSGYVSGAVVEKAGMLTVSQAFIDRAGPGISGDVFAWQQLKEQLGAQVDLYAIQQALANAQAVTNAGSFALTSASGVGGLLGDLKKAKSKLTDTAGVRIRATHAFATSDLVDYATGWADAQGRPVFEPAFDDNLLPIRAGGDPDGEGYSGYVLSGLALFADDSIPVSGSDTQVIVTRPRAILQLESAPITYLAPQGSASNLESVLGVRQYIATVPRYPSAVSVVSGAAYAAATFA